MKSSSRCTSRGLFIRAVSRQVQVEMRAGHIYVYYLYKCRLQPVNLFGGRIVNDDEDADSREIEFVPAWIDDTEEKYGRVLFLSFSAYDEDNNTTSEDDSDHPFMQTHTVSSLAAGEKEKKSEYYDRIYVGFWDGSQNTMGKLPRPWVEDIEVMDDWSNFSYLHFSLRINNGQQNRRRIIHNIEPKMKTTFKFLVGQAHSTARGDAASGLSDTIPDVRAVFYIKGKKYLCEKITATFTENGMSQLLKGVFYPIVD